MRPAEHDPAAVWRHARPAARVHWGDDRELHQWSIQRRCSANSTWPPPPAPRRRVRRRRSSARPPDATGASPRRRQRGPPFRKPPEQRALEVTGAAVARLGHARGRAFDDLHDHLGQVRAQRRAARGVRPTPCASRTSPERRALDRMASREQVEQQDAEAVDLARRRRRAPLEQLGRHVERRAEQVARRRAFGVARAAEVHQDDAAADLAHHVVRLDVAVQEAGGVQRGERPAQVEPDARRLARAHRALRIDEVGERAALDELHPDAGQRRRLRRRRRPRRRWGDGCGRGAAPRRAEVACGRAARRRSSFRATSRSRRGIPCAVDRTRRRRCRRVR